MTEPKKESKSLLTPEGRGSFIYCFEPSDKKTKKGASKYQLTILFKKGEDLSKLQAAAQKVITDKFGTDKEKWPKKLKSPFLDQGDYDYEGYEAGAKMIRVSTTRKPQIVSNKKDPATGKPMPVTDSSELYPGCWLRASVNAGWYDVDGNKGVSFFLNNVQKLRDGPPISGGSRAEDEFDAADDGAFEESPAAGGDSMFG